MAGNPMMLDKFFDKSTRTDIKNFVESYCNLEIEYDILIVGSPNAWEIQDININTKSKINLVCVDLSSVFENEFKNSTYGFKSSKFISANIFKFESDTKFDIIINRWFLHHLTTNNKKDFFTKCKNLTKDSAVIFSIDYFFRKFSNMSEKLICATEYNQYRSLYSPEPNLEKFLNVVKDAEVENYRGGKMDCIANIQYMLESLDLKVEYQYTSDASQVDNPELWGHYILKTTK
jgi:hypothetical protein